jgi:glycosyltransferase 2 family protein
MRAALDQLKSAMSHQMSLGDVPIGDIPIAVVPIAVVPPTNEQSTKEHSAAGMGNVLKQVALRFSNLFSVSLKRSSARVQSEHGKSTARRLRSYFINAQRPPAILRLWPYLPILIALPFVAWWLLSRVPLADLLNLTRSLSLVDLAGLALFNVLAMLIFSARWWLILRAQGYRLPYLSVFRYRIAGFAVSYFTPGTQFGGEPLQVYALSSRHSVPVSAALASVTLDKLFELIASFTFLSIGVTTILYSRQTGEIVASSLMQSTVWAAGLLCLPLAYLALLGAGRSPASGILRRISARWQRASFIARLTDTVTQAEAQISVLIRQKPVVLLWVALASGLVWIVSLAEYWLALHAFEAVLSPLQTVIALTAARLAFLSPVPGGLGALEAGQMFAMQTMGFIPALGIAISLWIRVRDTALGLAGLWLGAALLKKGGLHPLGSQAGD